MLQHLSKVSTKYPDANYPFEMARGMRVSGPIARSHV